MKRIAWLLLLSGCEAAVVPTPHAPAAEVAHAVPETELPVVQLSADAVARLGIEISVVERGDLPHTRLVGGEVIVPPGRAVTVTAPVAGMVRFAGGAGLAPGSVVTRGAALLRLTAVAPTDRDTHARVTREVLAAEATLAALELRVVRNQALVDERAGSSRALEEAIAARDVAAADLTTARSRAATLARSPLLSDVALVVRAPSDGVVRALSVAEGQVLPAGTALLEIVAVDALQVRVSVYSGDLGRVDPTVDAQVRRPGERHQQGSPAGVLARFTTGPPTAEPSRGTVDRYLALPPEAGFVPGERVLVELPLSGAVAVLSVPSSSIVLDAWGGAWVYRCEEQRYQRVRVDPRRTARDRTVLAHGPPVGACVVSTGASEIFGAEFPPGH